MCGALPAAVAAARQPPFGPRHGQQVSAARSWAQTCAVHDGSSSSAAPQEQACRQLGGQQEAGCTAATCPPAAPLCARLGSKRHATQRFQAVKHSKPAHQLRLFVHALHMLGQQAQRPVLEVPRRAVAPIVHQLPAAAGVVCSQSKHQQSVLQVPRRAAIAVLHQPAGTPHTETQRQAPGKVSSGKCCKTTAAGTQTSATGLTSGRG